MDVTSDWSNWGGSFIDTSYDQPIYSDTQLSNVAQLGQNVSTTPVNDGWGDWFKTVASGVIGYAVQKDAQQNQIRQPGANTAYVQPANYATAQRQGLSLSNPLVLIAGAALAIYLVKS